MCRGSGSSKQLWRLTGVRESSAVFPESHNRSYPSTQPQLKGLGSVAERRVCLWLKGFMIVEIILSPIVSTPSDIYVNLKLLSVEN
jgi:hypothetical protein